MGKTRGTREGGAGRLLTGTGGYRKVKADGLAVTGRNKWIQKHRYVEAGTDRYRRVQIDAGSSRRIHADTEGYRQDIYCYRQIQAGIKDRGT